MKVLAGIIGGLVFAYLSTFLVSLIFFPISSELPRAFTLFILLLLWGAGIAIAVRAPSAAKAWRRLLISSSVLSFLLPLSTLVLSWHFANMNTSPDAEYASAQTAGAVIGGGLLSGFMGFVGFFLGISFLIIGLLVGRDKQVIYVQAPPGRTDGS